MAITSDVKQEMHAAVDHLKTELANVRTGRAHPALLQGVSVEVYGAEMRLSDVANVTTPEARQLLITPYDANNANAIGKAIDKANLSVQAIVDGNSVRVTIPPLDESQRKEMVKLCRRKCEEGKVTIRNIRRKYNDLVRRQKSESEITEDVQKREEKAIQTLTDEFCTTIDKLDAEKEKDILTV